MSENGFITALGTPLDQAGNFIPDSMAAHIENQIDAGAAALLCMGSMGQQPYISNSQYPLAAKASAQAVKGRIPLYVGVSDTSVKRVAERIDAIQNINIDGVVATASYYATPSQDEIVLFFNQIADQSAYPLYLYDLPSVSQVSFASETVLSLMAHPNIRGIKSANIIMLRKVMRDPSFDPKFKIFFSGLDMMDIALEYGIKGMLDGMFTCTPVNSKKFGRCISAGDFRGAAEYLDRIIQLRDVMIIHKLRPSFTYIMNLLGFSGSFFPDHPWVLNDSDKEALRSCMTDIGEF